MKEKPAVQIDTMKRPDIAGWGIVVNENKAAMAILNRDELIETMKYIEVLEQKVKDLQTELDAFKEENQFFSNVINNREVALMKMEGKVFDIESENKKLKEELSLLRNESFTESNLIDFVNYYLKLHELPFRYTLENRTIIEEWKMMNNYFEKRNK